MSWERKSFYKNLAKQGVVYSLKIFINISNVLFFQHITLNITGQRYRAKNKFYGTQKRVRKIKSQIAQHFLTWVA